MSKNPYRAESCVGRLFAFVLGCALFVPPAASAQFGYRSTVGAYAESPAERLARNVRLLAATPRNFEALIGAGRAALALGDTQAAIGFFGRAEEIIPRSPLPKAGIGAALAAMNQPREALGYFDEAARLGAGAATLGADRGLALDLIGSQARAQADYRAALAGPDGDEARRRLALSLAISGDRGAAIAALEPLLARRDPAANRIRALVMALTGDVDSARRTVDAAMPGMARSMEPFLRRLAVLGPAEKAAAVHFGHIPDGRRPGEPGGSPRLATVVPRPVPAMPRSAPPAPPLARPGQAPSAAATASGAPDRSQARLGTVAVGRGDAAPAPPPPRTVFSLPSQAALTAPAAVAAPPPATPVAVAVKAPVAAPPIAVVPDEARPVAGPAMIVPQLGAPQVVPPPQAASPPVAVTQSVPRSSADRLREIDRLLALPSEDSKGVDKDLLAPAAPELAEAPPPRPQPKFEAAPPPKPQAKAASPSSKTKPDKAETIAKAGDPAAKTSSGDKGKSAESAAAKTAKPVAKSTAKPAPKPVAKSPRRHWVQLAGGARVERMPIEYKRIKAAKPTLFAKRTPHVAELKGWSRLLVGPFKSEDEAQAFVNELAKADIDGFAWTSPTGQEIDKLPAK